MKASEYLTRPELGLTKAQVECVTQLANICGIDSMFEGLAFGGFSKASAAPAKTAAPKEEPKDDKPSPMASTSDPLFSDEADVQSLDDIIGNENYSRSAVAEDDVTGSIDDPATDLADENAFANQSGEAEERTAPEMANGLIGGLVNAIAKIYGHDRVMDVNAYLENGDKAREYVDSYIANMSNNLRSTTGDNIGARLTGSEENSVDDVTIQQLKRLLEAFRDKYYVNDKDSSVGKAIEDILDAITNGIASFDSKAGGGYAQSNADTQVLNSILGGNATGSSRDYNNSHNLARKSLQRLKALRNM